jgi:hypothetical protein
LSRSEASIGTANRSTSFQSFHNKSALIEDTPDFRLADWLLNTMRSSTSRFTLAKVFQTLTDMNSNHKTACFRRGNQQLALAVRTPSSMTVEPEANGVAIRIRSMTLHAFANVTKNLARAQPVSLQIHAANVGNLYEDGQASYLVGMLFVHNNLRRCFTLKTRAEEEWRRNSLQTHASATNPLRDHQTYHVCISCFL